MLAHRPLPKAGMGHGSQCYDWPITETEISDNKRDCA